MPALIPRAPLPETRAAPIPQAQQIARLDMSGVNAGVQRLGGIAQDFIARKMEQADHARLEQARAELAAFGTELYDPENPAGVHSFRGERALQANEALLPQVDQRISQIRQRLTPRQQAQFDGMATGWRTNLADGLNRHMAAESERFMAAQSQALNQQMTSEAVLHGLNGAPDLQQASVAELQAANARRLELQGAPREAIALASVGVASSVYRATALGLANRSLPEAVAYYNKVAGSLTAEDRIAVEATVFPAIRAEAGTAAGLAAVNGGEIAGTPTLRTGEEMAAGAAEVQRQYEALGARHGFVTTSTTRSKAENERVGGVENSQHLDHRGTARDWSIKGKTPEQVQAFVADLRAAGFEVITKPHGTGPHIHAELPPITRSAQRTRVEGPARTEAEALLRLRESPVAADPVALQAAEAVVKREFSLADALRADAERQQDERSNIAIHQGAASASLEELVGPAAYARYVREGSVEAWEKVRLNRINRTFVQDDPVFVEQVAREAITDPSAFLRRNFDDPRVQLRLSTPTLAAFKEQQADYSKPEGQDDYHTQEQRLELAYAGLGITRNEERKGAFRILYLQAERDLHQRLGRKPNPTELDALVRSTSRIFAQRMADKATGIYAEARQAVQSVPQADRNRLRDEYRRKYGVDPTEAWLDEFIERWTRQNQ